VVGRLVEQQQVGPLPGDQRQCQPALLTTGEGFDRSQRAFGTEAETAQKAAQ
jgi:hypothetical protein